MASGSSYVNVGGHWRVVLEWSNTHDVTNNRSNVNVKVFWQGTSGYATTNTTATKNGSVTINGTRYAFTSSAKISGAEKKLIHERSVWVGHDANGTKSIPISATFDMALTLEGVWRGSATTSLTANLGQIPRASSISLNKTTVNYGDVVRFTIGRASSSFRHNIYMDWNGTVERIWSNIDWVVGDWTVPWAYISRIPNASSSWGTIRVETLSGSTVIGNSSVRLNTNVPANVVPTVSAPSTGISGSGRDKVINKYVQNISKVAVSFTSAGTYGSTIKSNSISIAGVSNHSGLSATSGVLKNSGSVRVTVSTTDSRNRTASRFVDISVHAYTPPSISMFTATRTTGETVSIVRNVAWHPVGGSNTSTIKVDKRVVKGAWSNIRSDNGSGTVGTANVTFNNEGNNEATSYEFRVSVTDSFGYVANSSTTVSTAGVPMSWGRKGMAAGKIYDEAIGGAFQTGDAHFDGKVRFIGGIEAVPLPDAGDLNDVILGGVYHSSSRTINNPRAAWGLLTVITDDEMRNSIQYYTARDGKAETFVRSKANGSEWKKWEAIVSGSVQTGTTLWEGAAHMTNTQSITPTEKLNDCPNGWGFAWSYYNPANQTPGSHDWNYTYVSKTHNGFQSTGVSHVISTNSDIVLKKYTYINNTTISGWVGNSVDGRQYVVLRKVFAW